MGTWGMRASVLMTSVCLGVVERGAGSCSGPEEQNEVGMEE